MELNSTWTQIMNMIVCTMFFSASRMALIVVLHDYYQFFPNPLFVVLTTLLKNLNKLTVCLIGHLHMKWLDSLDHNL